MTEYPTMAAEWWQFAEAGLDDLADLVSVYHPAVGKQHPHEITAAKAEELCEAERKKIVANASTKHPGDEFREAVAIRDADKACRILGETWWGLRESASVRSERGFGLLCDLCSEAGVLYEQAE